MTFAPTAIADSLPRLAELLSDATPGITASQVHAAMPLRTGSMTDLPPAQRLHLLAHLAGPQPVTAAQIPLVDRLRGKRLLKPHRMPINHRRPRRTQLTANGRRLAEQLQQAMP